MHGRQHVYRFTARGVDQLQLPSARTPLMEGVHWGRHDCLFTPAYWAAQAWIHAEELEVASGRIGTTLAEEIAACLLGGHGMPAEVGLAAFRRVRDEGLLCGETSADQFLRALSHPLTVGNRQIRYRFARQRSMFLSHAMSRVAQISAAVDSPLLFRSQLLQIRGVGLKTASWIVRNWTGSDCVAILDIHIFRAGVIAGFYAADDNIARHYLRLEDLFLRFAMALSVRAS